MGNFKSKYYPRSGNFLMVMQEYALRYYSVLFAFLMIAILLRLNAGMPLFKFSMGGTVICLILGNLLAWIRINNVIAEILFISDSFSMITVYDIVSKGVQKSFPLIYANPNKDENQIQVHFKDKVVNLNREDWEEFDLLWTWFIQR